MAAGASWRSATRTAMDEASVLPGFPAGVAGRVHGTGAERVLWIHGYTLDSSTWAPVWARLPRQTHYGIDLPGHGGSAALARGASLRAVGDALAGAATDAGIRHIVGLSFGSLLALEIVLARPGAFETLTMAAPTVAGGPLDHDVGRRYVELGQLYRTRGPGPWMTELWMRTPPGTFAYASPELASRLRSVIDRYQWAELSGRTPGVGALARERQDLRTLAASRVRLLVLVGEHELPAFRETAAELRRTRPDAETAELTGAGHLCVLHAPSEAASHIERFWDMRAPRAWRSGRRARSISHRTSAPEH